jgi:DNA repair exonuclease SbcCD nuclease subunit
MNLGMILKMLGVKVAPEQLAQLEAIIPQIPAKISEVIAYLNGAIKNFDDRLRARNYRMAETIVTVSGPPESEPQSEPTTAEIEGLTEEVQTVADDILLEVKECRARQDQLQADLTSLREAGELSSQREAELLTELRNLREENRNLLSELKTLVETYRSQSPPEESSPSIPSQSQIAIVTPQSAEEESPAQPTKKKHRYRI